MDPCCIDQVSCLDRGIRAPCEAGNGGCIDALAPPPFFFASEVALVDVTKPICFDNGCVALTDDRPEPTSKDHEVISIDCK